VSVRGGHRTVGVPAERRLRQRQAGRRRGGERRIAEENQWAYVTRLIGCVTIRTNLADDALGRTIVGPLEGA